MKNYTSGSACCHIVLIAQCLIAASCAPLSHVPWEVGLRDTSGNKDDLLHQSRKWTVNHGRAEARDRLVKALAKRDESGGFLESRMMAANGNKSLVFPNSLHTIPMEDRKKIAIYFVLGFNQETGRTGPIIKRACEHIYGVGFAAQFINVTHRNTAQSNAKIIAARLKEDLPHVEKAILIGFSRGSTDIVHFWLEETEDIPEADLQKIKVWVNFSGVIRGSLVARWIAMGRDPMAWVTRGVANAKDRSPCASMLDFASIGYDSWSAPNAKLPSSVRRRVHVLNFVVIPDGNDGWAPKDPYNNIIAKKAAVKGPVMGPCDGLIESAATILPPHTGLKQSIVRVRGSHLLLSGKYLNGNLVAPEYYQGRRARLDSGGQLMDDFIRAMPRSLLK